MHCQICGNELKGCVCPDCGFDLSRCAELYPTLTSDAAAGDALWKYRRALYLCARSGTSPWNPAAPFSWKVRQGAAKPAQPPQKPTASADSGPQRLETVLFGSWCPRGEEAERKPLEWLVLAQEDASVLLISKFSLRSLPFNGRSLDNNWEESTLRSWLNREFYQTAFSEAERKLIRKALNNTKNSQSTAWTDCITEDIAFLLTAEEAARYFQTNALRRCLALSAAQSDPNGSTPGSPWWLRSPGSQSSRAAFVNPDGDIFEGGCRVDLGTVTVRPAIWVTDAAFRNRSVVQ